jgi:hypothetical protein
MENRFRVSFQQRCRRAAIPHATLVTSFVAKRPGDLATSTKAHSRQSGGRAVAEVDGLRLSGFAAWLTWLTVHIYDMVGFRRRPIVMAQWACLYLRNERGARLISGDAKTLLERGQTALGISQLGHSRHQQRLITKKVLGSGA